MRLRFTLNSIEDLARLREFIEVHDPSAASRAAASILSALNRLKRYPRLGAPVARAPDPDLLRDLHAANYTIRYLIGKRYICILRIWHDRETERKT